MSDIKVDTRFQYYPSAHMECEEVMKKLGFKFVIIDAQRGSHTASIYIPKEDQERFRNELYHKTVEGTYRRFFFNITHIPCTDIEEFYVNYLKKIPKKY